MCSSYRSAAAVHEFTQSYAALKPEPILRNIVSIGQTSLDSIVMYDETVTPHVTCYRYAAPGAAKYNTVYMYISDATLHYQI